MNDNIRKKIALIVATICVVFLGGFGFYEANRDKSTKEIIANGLNEIKDYISTYEMTEKEIEELPSTEIVEQTEEQEKEVSKEQEVESEAFEEQGEIAYNGTSEYPNVSLGDYKGLTYYSQIDNRWSSHLYTSVGSISQNIGTSGCGPTSAAMVVTAIKGAITPPEMGDLFVKYGYRSADNGTYWSAFKFVADTFNIEYSETYRLDDVVNLLRNEHYVIASCANGLFTTGGHFIVLTGIDGDKISIYDPYLYSGKFETSTRRGKVTVNGNTVYCSIDNFRNYANYQKFFAYKHEGNVTINNSQNVNTASYTRYVNAKIGLNVRNAPNGNIVGALSNGTKVTVYETSGNWSKIGNLQWVSSDYLATGVVNNTPTINNTTVGTYYTLKNATTLYSKSNLTGIRYSYLPQTKIKVISHINSSVDYIYVVKTGRYAYCPVSAYQTTNGNSTVGQYRVFKSNTILYANSNLTGRWYSYLPQTQVKIIKNVSSNVDYVYVVRTGRYAYVNANSYR